MVVSCFGRVLEVSGEIELPGLAEPLAIQAKHL
jgi:hypothetical protein